MTRVNISIPETLYNNMRTLIPARQRRKVIAELLNKEIKRREKELHECALAVKKDEVLNKEMADWETTVADGLDTE